MIQRLKSNLESKTEELDVLNNIVNEILSKIYIENEDPVSKLKINSLGYMYASLATKVISTLAKEPRFYSCNSYFRDI